MGNIDPDKELLRNAKEAVQNYKSGESKDLSALAALNAKSIEYLQAFQESLPELRPSRKL